MIVSRVKLALALLLGTSCLTASATEVAILRNGFTIRHEKRILVGNTTRLFLSTADETSFIDVPTAEIERIEPDLTPAPPPDPAPPTTATPQTGVVASPAIPTATASLPPARSTANVADAVSAASDRYRLDPDLLNSVIRAESGFNPHAVSRKGAQGLMQLMPETASKLGVPNAFDPEANVDGGTRYLRELLERYNFDLIKALAAYNAGTKRVEQYHGVPPYQETRHYVASIVRDFNRKKLAQQKAAKAAQAQTAAQAKASVPTTGQTKTSTRTGGQRKTAGATSATQTIAKRTNPPTGN
jgi:soluble lytic murein transglycosylase-like protein